jgi:sialidase-1
MLNNNEHPVDYCRFLQKTRFPLADLGQRSWAALKSLFLFQLILGGTATWSAAEGHLPPSLRHFLDADYFQTQEMWSGETGGRSIITALNGDVVVIKGGASSQYKRSTNGGLTWTAANASSAARFSNALLDETNGRIIVFNGSSNVRSFSTDNGLNWSSTQSHLPSPDRFGFRPTTYSSMQAGITLRYGPKAGRLVSPGRTQTGGSNDIQFRGYNYSSGIYSDDGGQTWQTSQPFPVFGTGEAAIVELKDGRLLYNSREHMSIGNRFIATSHDGGETWVSPYRDPTLPDGPRGTSYGCLGGLIRLPVDQFDILLYSNLDTNRGELPDEIGGTRTRERENITVWASFDGGVTWPVKRLIFEGPSAYSTLGVGRAGTASQGKIYLVYDGGPEGRNTAAQIVVFNLSWLLDGADIGDYLQVDNVSGEPAEVVGQYVYHRSYTGDSERLDSQKIVAKEGLGPKKLDYRNLINTAHGINGIVMDVNNLAEPESLSANDFKVQVSPTGTFDEAIHPPSLWRQGPTPSYVNVTPGPTSRIIIEWPDYSIMNRWLRITVKANQTSGLPDPAVFYLGHLLGEVTGNQQSVFSVNFSDIVPIRSAIGQLVGADSILDIDKNGVIALADISVMRPNVGAQLTRISIP